MCFIIAAYRYSPRLPDAPGRTGRGLRAEDLPAQLVAAVVPQAAVGDQGRGGVAPAMRVPPGELVRVGPRPHRRQAVERPGGPGLEVRDHVVHGGEARVAPVRVELALVETGPGARPLVVG